MGDMREDFDALKAHNKARKEKNLQSANPEGWTVHTPYHWTRKLNGKHLDYWPSKNKFMYQNNVMHGNVSAFIAKRENKPIN